MTLKKKSLLTALLTLTLILLFTPTASAESIKLNKSKLQLNVGDSTTLKINGTSNKVTWKSNNKSIATVSSSGKVTAKKAGKAVITATVNKKSYACNITVSKSQSTKKSTYYIGTNDTMQLKAPSLTGKITWTSNNPDVVTVSKTGVISSPLGGSAIGSAIVTARSKTGKHSFYIYVDGSYLRKTEILLFEKNTARINIEHSLLHDKYTLKVGDSSIAKSELITYTKDFCFEVTGVKPGTTTITVVGDGKRTYKLKVTVVKKNKEVQKKAKKVVNLLEKNYEMVPNETSQTKHYILNPEAASWEQASITVTKDNEYVGFLLPQSGTGTESWLSIVKEVIKIMAPKHATSLYNDLISDPFISSSKVIEGMNVTTLSHTSRYLEFESGTIRD
mgnify:FL=1